jgi:dUTP pyrophosphatase
VARRARTVVVESTGGATRPLPVRATPGSACFDLAAAEATTVVHGAVVLVPTGFKMRCPRGTFLEVRPRSGLSSKGVVMVNAPGTVDSDYAGEVFVPMTYLFEGSYRLNAGDRIAQIRLVAETPARFRRGSVRPTTHRRGGFGSTGR